MKYISASAALLFIFIAFATKAQNSPVLTLGKVSTASSAVTLPVTAAGFSNIASGDMKIVYDPEVTTPKKVTLGPDMTGTFAYNFADTGIIRIGWFTYPPVTLTDNSVIFTIEFAKVTNGTSMVNFDDGIISPVDCQFHDGSHKTLNDEPFSSYYLPGSVTFNEPAGPITTAPALAANTNENLAVPVTVKAFRNVGAVSLTMQYDPAVLDFISAENTGGFPGLILNDPVPGTVTVSGTINEPDGYSLPDESVFFTLNFRYLGGSTTLSWNDEDGSSCEYSGPLSASVFPDSPQSEYYINGMVEQSLAPAAPEVQLAHPACDVSTGTIEITAPIGEEYNYSTDGINYQPSPVFSDLFSGTYNVTVMNDEGYVSSITTAVIEKQPYTPVGPALDTAAPTCEKGSIITINNYNPNYTYSFFPGGPVACPGGEITGLKHGQSYSVTAISADGCESAPSEPFTAEDKLEAPEPEIDSEYREDGTVVLTAGEGESYLWSTGETTRSIVATTTGEYIVEVIYANGCSAVSAPMSVIISSALYIETNKGVEIKAYPNPFSDWFRIEFTSPEPAQAHLELYDTNGRLIKSLLHREIEAGIVYRTEYTPANLINNVYYYKLSIGNQIYRGKLVYNSGSERI